MPNYRLLYLAQEGRCFYCDTDIVPRQQGAGQRKPKARDWTRDHLLPKRDGFDANDNTVLACSSCNSRKGHRAPTAAEIERYKALEQRMLYLKVFT